MTIISKANQVNKLKIVLHEWPLGLCRVHILLDIFKKKTKKKHTFIEYLLNKRMLNITTLLRLAKALICALLVNYLSDLNSDGSGP